MLTAHWPTSKLPTRPAPTGHLRRLVLRLRSRWLRWRGRAVLKSVSRPQDAPVALVARTDRYEEHRQALLKLNLMLEHARRAPASPPAHEGDRPGLAG